MRRENWRRRCADYRHFEAVLSSLRRLPGSCDGNECRRSRLMAGRVTTQNVVLMGRSAVTREELPFRVIHTRVMFANPVLEVSLDQIVNRQGQQGEWTIVTAADGVAVVPVHADGSVTLIRQYRHAIGQWSWEIPAGRQEAGETKEATARRELIEEAGLMARVVEPLLSLFPLNGFCRHSVHLMRGTDLVSVAPRHETFEEIEVHRLPMAEIQRMIRAGEIRCGIALSALAAIGSNI